MHAAHQAGDAVRTLVSAPRLSHQRNGQPATFWGLAGSASVRGRQALVTAVNPSLTDARETQVVIRGGAASRATATVLTAPVMNAHNTFEAPDTVKPAPLDARVVQDSVAITIPPMSVVAVQMELG
jgi:alpha-N-arabinofuranosidase